MKIILIIISSYLFILNQLHAEIIYNKNNNVITLFELNEYSIGIKKYSMKNFKEKAIKI